MTRDDVRAAAERVTRWHERFVGLFGRTEPRGHSLVYLKGLMSQQKRKSIEPIALQFARGPKGAAATQNEVVALQGFVTHSPWEAIDVFQEIQAVFAEELVPTTAQWPLGTVGVIDESSFKKAGAESVGVARQWCGRLGKTDNCQVGVFLVGVTPCGVAGLDAQLFLTEAWAADRKRRENVGVPREVRFQTKPQIAAEMVRRTRAAGRVPLDWIVADSLYGDSGEFLDTLEGMNQNYLAEVRKNALVWTVDPATLPGKTPGPKMRKKLGSYRYREVRSVQEIAADLPADAWRPLKLREGTKGPLVCEFAVLRVWAMRHDQPGPPIWLLIRRSLDGKEVWYYVSNADEQTPWETLAMVAGTRFRVEEYFQDGKTHLGMADYEARAWTSWHHHMALVALAHLYVTLTKRDVKHEVPELTLDMAMRILRAAFAKPTLNDQEAINLIDYHLERNDVAYESHRKTWLAKHIGLSEEVLL
ncbi:MAG: IS701 family transposase [Planctomycetota bacterium]|nr:IS701 family transposase [Planctomycetota bacterium]